MTFTAVGSGRATRSSIYRDNSSAARATFGLKANVKVDNFAMKGTTMEEHSVSSRKATKLFLAWNGSECGHIATYNRQKKSLKPMFALACIPTHHIIILCIHLNAISPITYCRPPYIRVPPVCAAINILGILTGRVTTSSICQPTRRCLLGTTASLSRRGTVGIYVRRVLVVWVWVVSTCTHIRWIRTAWVSGCRGLAFNDLFGMSLDNREEQQEPE